jgi:hypothetical protein
MFYYYAECQSAECHYAECRYAECRYAECRYAECRSAVSAPLLPWQKEEKKNFPRFFHCWT